MANGGVRSTLNPNAPLFIPASFRQVEDFSPEWWFLVKTSLWFRDHWINEHQDQETFDGGNEDDDDTEFSSLEEELEEVMLEMEAAEQATSLASLKKDKSDADITAMVKSLSLEVPGNGRVSPRTSFEPAKHKEKPLKCLSPKCSPRRIIQQPR